jgi:hypothetical protein
MAKYKLKNVPLDKGVGSYQVILDKDIGAVIPKDEGNKDYQEYLEWVAAGNTAEAAD